MRVVVPDVAAYERFLKDVLTRLEGVAGIKSSFALKQVKYSTVLPLDSAVKTQQELLKTRFRVFKVPRSWCWFEVLGARQFCRVL